MKTSSLEKYTAVESSLSVLLRYAAYTLLIFIATTSLPAVLQSGNIAAFKEGGWIERSQLLLLGATSSLYFYEAFFSAHHRAIFHFLACVSVFGMFRELDAFLDYLVPLIGWKIGFIFVFYALFSAYAHRKVFLQQIQVFLATHSMVILWAGFIVAIPIGQLIGHGDFLKALMGDNYDRDYKRLIEETLELLGYILVLAGTIEAIVELRAEFNRRPTLEMYKVPRKRQSKLLY